jgi:hypothetical protein
MESEEIFPRLYDRFKFDQICVYVKGRLVSEPSFAMKPSEFRKRFGLKISEPFYRQLVQRVMATGMPSVTDGYWCDDVDPIDPIVFSRFE